MFDPFIKLNRFMWQWRWWLVILSSLMLFFIMNTAPITNDSGAIAETDWLVRLNFALIFALLAAQLIAWIIGVLHTLVTHRIKWFIFILALPPVVFVYLFIKNSHAEH